MSSCLQWLTVVLAIFSSSWQLTQSDLADHLQPDDVGSYYKFAPDSDKRSCHRECKKGESPRQCYYHFVVEQYATMSGACGNCSAQIEDCFNEQCVPADGFERGALTVNRRLYGPSIQVCYGDQIIVDVENRMPARSTTIHWHGIFQKGTQWSDGVPMVTQCPIVEDTMFRYAFYANQPGTFYWHSHDGNQKLDGLQGSLVVREPKEDCPNRDLYDVDLPAHVMFLSDWMHHSEGEVFPGPRQFNVLPTFFLFNGQGRYTDPESGTNTGTPYAVFTVERGLRHRFRIIAGTCTHCSTRLEIQDHNLTLIATDANPVKPVVVDHLVLSSGERYDVVLNADKEVKSYWIRIQGIGICSANNIYQLAVLQYKGAKTKEPTTAVPEFESFKPGGLVLNPENATCGEGQNGVCVSQLQSITQYESRILTAEPDLTVVWGMGYYYPEYPNNLPFVRPEPDPVPDTVLWVNHIALKLPNAPLLSQKADVPKDAYCPVAANGTAVCNKDICHCCHVLKVKHRSIVEFVLIDYSDGAGVNHPWHIHGHAFQVMDMGYTADRQNDADQIIANVRSKKRDPSWRPVTKDTVAVPSTGYAVVRIYFDNPGYWMFHCHMVIHHVVGMAAIVQVGEQEDMLPVPTGFPKCGDFRPSLEDPVVAAKPTTQSGGWMKPIHDTVKKAIDKVTKISSSFLGF